jgi:hypothetical protein
LVSALGKNAFPPPGGLGPGTSNAPAATVCAKVMVVPGRFNFARLSQETAGAAKAAVLSNAVHRPEAATYFPAWVARQRGAALRSKQIDFIGFFLLQPLKHWLGGNCCAPQYYPNKYAQV